MGTTADNAPVSTEERVIPSQGVPGAVTAIATRQLGESPIEALERVGNAVLPVGAVPKRARGKQLPQQIAGIIAMRTEGLSDKQIAEKLGLAINTIRNILGKARRDHGLADVVDRVQNRAIPAAVDNMIERLDEGDDKFTKYLLDKTLFKKESAKDGKNSGGNTLTVKIELPVIPEGAPAVAIGAIVGKPQSAIDGEVVG